MLGLSLRGAGDCFGRFELEDQDTVDDDVCYEDTDILIVEDDGNRHFLLHFEACFAQSDDERTPVNGFEESIPKFIVHRIEDADDAMGQVS